MPYKISTLNLKEESKKCVGKFLPKIEKVHLT